MAPEVKTARVFRIVRLMNAGEWKPAMAGELAAEWRLAEKSVQVMSAEAKRILDITVGDRTELVKGLRLRLLEISTLEGADRVHALRTLLEHLGEMRKRVEMSGPDGAPIPIGVTARVVVLPSEEQDEGGDEAAVGGESGP